MTVQALLTAVLPQLQGQNVAFSFFGSVNLAIEVLFKHLWQRKSDIVREDLALSFDAGDGSKALPGTFRGFYERPFVDGRTRHLEPLPPGTRASVYGESGIPSCYELRGTALHLYPATQDAATIRGLYINHPGTIADLTDTIPFDGLFDEVFKDAVVRIIQNGLAITTDQEFLGLVYSSIDSVLDVRTSHQAMRRPVRDF